MEYKENSLQTHLDCLKEGKCPSCGMHCEICGSHEFLQYIRCCEQVWIITMLGRPTYGQADQKDRERC
jgi:hypothetical protein